MYTILTDKKPEKFNENLIETTSTTHSQPFNSSIIQLLYKYIFINDDSFKNFIFNVKKDFFVYMITVDESKDNKPEDSQIQSPKLLLSKFSRDERRNSKDSDTKESKQKTLSLKIQSKSKIPVKSHKTPLQSRLIQRKKHSSLTDIARKESEVKFKGYDIFKKIIGIQKPKVTTSNQDVEAIFVREASFNSKDDDFKIDDLQTCKFEIPSAFIEVNNVELLEAMKEILDLNSKIRKSEDHVKNMICKYIQDNTLQKDLVNIISGHEKILLETERRALNLAGETWMQQAELFKEQQKNLQSTLNAMITQNRELQCENENLIKKCEKMSHKMIALDGSPVASRSSTWSGVNTTKFQKDNVTHKLIEDLNKSNNKLRTKLSSTNKRMFDFENVLQKLQKKNEEAQAEIFEKNQEIENLKASTDRMKADYELEISKITHDVTMNKVLITEALEAGDSLINDLSALRCELKICFKTSCWESIRMNSNGESLVELIKLAKSSINELKQQLLYKISELQMHIQEKNTINEENAKQLNAIEELNDMMEKMNTKLEQSVLIENNYKELCGKYENLLRKSEENEKIIESKIKELQEKDNKIKESTDEVDNLKTMLAEKNSDYSQLESVTERLEQERNTLMMQVNGVAQVLSVTGAGDLAKELAMTQEKLMQVHEQYFAAVADKNYLLSQIESYNLEKQTLIAYQKNYHDQLQTKQQEFENLEKAFETTKEQLEVEKQTVLALQTERVRHLEERTILTAIYERLKAEIMKVDQLEGAVCTMNKKASKLAMIAEYNKQLGQKLQNEVAERDVTISTLQNNVKELNEFQLESTKEKAALCEELTQVCGVKEVLNTKLAAELERNLLLGECKKEIENVATIQLREMQIIYQKEHSALKNLLKEVKNMSRERDDAIHINKDLTDKIEKLEKENEKLVMSFNELQNSYDEKQNKFRQLENDMGMQSKYFENIKADIEHEMLFYKQSCDEMKEVLEPVKNENLELKKSVEFLQTTITKLRSELDDIRENEMSWKAILSEEIKEKERLQNILQEKAKSVDELSEGHEAVKRKLYELNEKYKELHKEYQKVSNEANQFEKILAEKFSTSKEVTPSSNDNDQSFEEITARDEEIILLQEKIREFEKNEISLKEIVESLSIEKESIDRERMALIKDLEDETLKTYKYEEKILDLENKLKDINQNDNNTKRLQDENESLKFSLEEHKREFSFKLQNLHSDLFGLTTKLSTAASEYETLSSSKLKLEKAHKEMALKLLRAAQVLIAEKVARQNTMQLMKKCEEDNAKLVSEIDLKNELIFKQNDNMEELKILIEKYKVENEHLSLLKIQYEDKCKQLEAKISSLNLNSLKHLEESRDDMECKAKLEEAEMSNTALKIEMDNYLKDISKLQEELSEAQSQCACLEFQKCEAILRLHELQGKMQTEKVRHEDMKRSLQHTLTSILEMRESGSITQSICNLLLSTINPGESFEM